MGDCGPWGVDPNSQHQLWSHWTFTMRGGKRILLPELRDNATRWVRLGFGGVSPRISIGQMRVSEKIMDYVIEVQIEGVPAHDLRFVERVRNEFQQNFVERGFGPTAISSTKVQVMAGDQQDGRARNQLIVLPRVKVM